MRREGYTLGRVAQKDEGSGTTQGLPMVLAVTNRLFSAWHWIGIVALDALSQKHDTGDSGARKGNSYSRAGIYITCSYLVEVERLGDRLQLALRISLIIAGLRML